MKIGIAGTGKMGSAIARRLIKQGHEVHVIHCRDAFEISRGDQSPRPYDPPPGVHTHMLSSAASFLSRGLGCGLQRSADAKNWRLPAWNRASGHPPTWGARAPDNFAGASRQRS